MASKTVKLTPTLINFGTEGSLDASIVGGVSKQRTVNMVEVVPSPSDQARSTTRKVASGIDGATVDDVIVSVGTLPFIVAL